MRFQHRARSWTLVVVPARKVFDSLGRELAGERGLRAKFRNPMTIDDPSNDGPSAAMPCFFDSEAAQRELGWSDEDRLRVERALLTHPSFGLGLYLVPGQTLPPELSDIKLPEPAQTAAPETTKPQKARCMFVRVDESGLNVQCKRSAKVDSDHCAQHEKIAQGVAA